MRESPVENPLEVDVGFSTALSFFGGPTAGPLGRAMFPDNGARAPVIFALFGIIDCADL